MTVIVDSELWLVVQDDGMVYLCHPWIVNRATGIGAPGAVNPAAGRVTRVLKPGTRLTIGEA